jgi:NAD(P)-dependent dehydrogenase (short-subunit alcohol dehydrogenase family)
VLVTGAAQGVGHATARDLLERGHDVVVHVRTNGRRDAVADLVNMGAMVVVADLGRLDDVKSLLLQLDSLGHLDAVIHNAGVLDAEDLLHVNVVAPYLVAARRDKPERQVFLSSDMHPGGRATLAGIDWSGRTMRRTYSDSKLFVTTLAFALKRLWPEQSSSAVDPGWVPTRMGGPSAPDSLELAHQTQVWLATSEDPEARAGGFWYHGKRRDPFKTVLDSEFQDHLIASLASYTGVVLDSG